MGKAKTRVRSYAVPHHANEGKVEALAALLPHWQRGLVHVQVVQVQRMRRGERIGFLDTKTFPSYLTQRQWKSVTNQVNAGLRSWAAITTQKMRPLIRALDTTPEERHHLYRENLAQRWWGDVVLAPMLSRLMRSSHPLPNFSKTRTMLMDGPIAQIEGSVTDMFNYWVRFTLGPGQKPVRVPVTGNPYMDGQEGNLRNFCQVRVGEENRVSIRFVKNSTVAPERLEGDIIGLDWGLANLLTTSDGRRYGQQLYAWLLERDQEITALGAALQKRGLRPRDSRRYRALNNRVRERVKNEVGRILNQIADHNLYGLTVESLDFRGKGLSSRLRRIVSRAGRGALNQKLSTLQEDRGITVTEVTAAYSSQECSGCGFASRGNRSSQSRFRCGFCDKTLHADVNAARVILGRRSPPLASSHTTRQQALTIIDHAFTTRWGVEPDQYRERQARPYSRATSVRSRGSTSAVDTLP